MRPAAGFVPPCEVGAVALMKSGSRRSRNARVVVPLMLVGTVAALTIVALGNFTAPPRYDGAGYSVLARALSEGRGYRSIDHPDQPPHAHFPPGYPGFLALIWSVTGFSPAGAHLASAVCVVVATVAAWWWFRRIYPPDAALVLGLALAVNWAWARTGSAIQSEPLYELLAQLSILLATSPATNRH